MSQNNSSNAPGQHPEQGEATSNPYYVHQHEAATPDLDANAPSLQSSDMQKLNRKALVFLAGIVALLVIAAVWMFRSATSGDDKVKAPPRQTTVRVPDLPQATSSGAGYAAAVAQPIEVQEYEQPALPPLPPQQLPPPAYSGNYPDAPPPQPREPTLIERRMLNSAGGGPEAGSQSAAQQDPYFQAMLTQVPGGQAAAESPPAARGMASTARFITGPDALLVRGTYIRCVLETRIITDVRGFTSCVVTEPIYSINGRRLLLPKGSKISGSYDSDARGPRVAVVWDRVTTPNGIDVTMSSPGVDNLGSAGHPGDYDAHWGSRIASALLISLISDAFKYAGEEHGPRSSVAYPNGLVVDQPFQSNTAHAVQRLADQAIEASANRRPTVTINQGTVVNVYVSRDVDFTSVLARD